MHPNDMTAWDTIRCQRRHAHHTRTVHVDTHSRHGYHDYPQLDMLPRLQWTQTVWDPYWHPVDGGLYCPAHDAVSATIVTHGIWEPQETALAASVLLNGPGSFYDIGAQIGWYANLARACGRPVSLIEADPDNAALLDRQGTIPEWALTLGRIDAATPAIPDVGIRWRLIKIDVEGAENHAVRILANHFESGNVDHALIEISPVFGPGYPELVERLVGWGYEAYLLPDKTQPPQPVLPAADALAAYRIDQRPDLTEYVGSWHQKNVWFKHRDAAW